MDYSYVPQMYQQGVTHNLDKQFQLAGQAQPVAQFLASLRQAKQMELQQQMEEDRQRRLDIEQQRADQQAQYQNANSLLAAGQHFSAEISPQNYDSYAATFKGSPFEKLLPKPTVETVPVGRNDYGPDQGSVSLDGETIPLTPESGPKTFTEIIKKPTGTNVKIRQDAEAGKNARAEASRQVKLQIAEGAQEIQRLKEEHRMETAPEKKQLLQARIDNLSARTERATRLLELNEPEAAVNALGARATRDIASAGELGSRIPLNAAKTALTGAQTTLTETRAENADMTDSEKAAAAAARAASGKKKTGLSLGPPPAAKGKPLPTDLKAQYDSITDPAKKTVAKKRLVDNGFMVP